MTKILSACLPALVAVSLTTACGSLSTSGPDSPDWDVERAERISWTPTDDRFGTDRAVEVSGLCLAPSRLYLASEKYPLLLELDLSGLRPPRVLELDLPPGAEIEGLAWSSGDLFLCDEANAAVYRVPISSSSDPAAGPSPLPLPAERIAIEGAVIKGGKSGLEGIAVSPDGHRVHLLHERERSPDGCHSTLYRFRLEGDRLVADGAPVLLALEDCNWRLSDLSRYRGRLYALRTQYPGERYELVLINVETASLTKILDLTATARAAAGAGYSNNLEGLAVSEHLYVASDNAATPRAVGDEPGQARQSTLLLFIPPQTASHTSSTTP